jgi:phosphoribosylanthranilate isomerase
VFRVKICGVTNVPDALLSAAAGADAIGLNFFPNSPRCVAIEIARQVTSELGAGVVKVGVFVDASPVEVGRIADQVGLDVLQLHGHEPPSAVLQLAARPVVKAFRCRREDVPQVIAYVKDCEALGCPPQAVLIDAFQPGSFGGTGRLADWSLIDALKSALAGLPVILAGGLRPDNVAEAIRVARPVAVDTASGVESRPGKKDENLVRQFVQNALTAFAASP